MKHVWIVEICYDLEEGWWPVSNGPYFTRKEARQAIKRIVDRDKYWGGNPFKHRVTKYISTR